MNQSGASLVWEIFSQGNLLAMSIYKQQEQSATLRHLSQLSFDEQQANILINEAYNFLNEASTSPQAAAEKLNNLKKSAHLLWGMLVSQQVRETLIKYSHANLTILLDEKLSYIPWEFLYDGENFLCLKFAVGRLIRTSQKIPHSRERDLTSQKPRMLIIADPTQELEGAYREGLEIKKEVLSLKRLSLDFKSGQIDSLALKKDLGEYDLLHFAGHCEHGGWVLSKGKFGADEISALAQEFVLPRFIFSNACESAGLANAFLLSGTRHYLGAIRKLEDKRAVSFSKYFYKCLAGGIELGECVRRARVNMVQEFGLSTPGWMNYILYGDPGYAFFEEVKGAQQKACSIRKNRKKLPAILVWIVLTGLIITLLITFPTLNPRELSLYFSCRQMLQEGKNEEVLRLGENLLKNKPDFLELYPLMADASQRLGKSDLAINYYFAYARESEKRKKYSELAQSYLGIGWVYHRQGDYQKAYEFYLKAKDVCAKYNLFFQEAVVLRKLAVWHLEKNENASALLFLTKSSEINRRYQHTREAKFNLACDYFDIGLVFANREDFPAAKEFYQKSMSLFKQLKMPSELSDCYFNLGEVHLFEKEYQKALDCYQKGLAIDEKHHNLANLAGDYNMLGELYLAMENYQLAEENLIKCRQLAQTINALPELANTYYNLGRLYRSKKEAEKAKEYFLKSQELYKRFDFPEYQKIKEEIAELRIES